MKQFFLDLIDKKSSKSSKRFLGFYCLGLLTIDLAAISLGVKIDLLVTETLKHLIIAALITTTVDHFGNGNKTE